MVAFIVFNQWPPNLKNLGARIALCLEDDHDIISYFQLLKIIHLFCTICLPKIYFNNRFWSERNRDSLCIFFFFFL